MSEGIQVRRANRGDLGAIAALVRKVTKSELQVGESDVMEWLFSKGLWVAAQDGELVGVVAYQTENLVSVTDVFHVSPVELWVEVGSKLLETVEAEVSTLMCEANVVLLPAWTSETMRTFLQEQGYEPKEFDQLHRIWREVLDEFVTDAMDLMIKQLRERMVMAPI
jgi:N-acetylglutamate synthase-like GNAT family acetyltransferase